jgi:hypothetical protein
VSAGAVSFTGPGTCVIDADQAGSADYLPAPESSQTVAVGAQPAFVLDAPGTVVAPGQSYSYTFVATGAPAPSYALIAGAPPWLSIDAASGLLKGTPPAGTRTFRFTVTAANAVGKATAGPFTVAVTPAPIALSCPSTAEVGHAFTCSLTVHSIAPSTATGLALEIGLPARSSVRRFTLGGKRNHQTVSWLRRSLSPGASGKFTLTLAATSAGKVTVTANASFNYVGRHFTESAAEGIAYRQVSSAPRR